MDLPTLYVKTTEHLLHAAGLSHEMAHGAGGLLLYLAALALPVARRWSILPLLGVAFAELLNETLQASFHGSWRLPDTMADVAWTLCVPTLLWGATLVRSAGFTPLGATQQRPANASLA